MLNQILEGFLQLFTLSNLLFINLGIFIGIIFGAVPGLTGNLGMILFLPVTFSMDPIAGISMLLGIYGGGAYGGSVSAILLGTPGSNAAVATVFDGYPLALKGKAKKALEMSLIASTIGGMISSVVLLVAAPLVAKVTVAFGPPEYFALAVFGLSIIAGVSGGNLVKGVISGCLGIVVAIVGLDAMSGAFRFTFGSMNLITGFNMLAVLLGIFAIPTILNKVLKREFYPTKEQSVSVGKEGLTRGELKESMPTILSSSLIGTGIGALPGAGAEVASFISYNNVKNGSKNPDAYGKGELRGVAAPESANNAVVAASMIPLITLGIPGSVNAAALIGALTMHDLIPGPTLFRNQAALMYSIIFALFFINIFMLVQGKILSKIFVKVIKVPNIVLIPLLVLFCVAGAFATTTSIFSVFVLLAFGLLGYILIKFEYPIAPLVLGMVLGPIMETNLRRSMTISDNGFMIFLTRPFCVVFLLLAVTLIAVLRLQNKKNLKANNGSLNELDK